jgi:hypothetical protein
VTAGGSFWLKNWAEMNSRSGANPHVGKYIGIYFAFGIGNAALVVLQTLILWIFCSIEVSLPSQTTVPLPREARRGCTKVLVRSRTCMKTRHLLAWTDLVDVQGSLADLAVPIVTDSWYRLRESYMKGWLTRSSAVP